MPDVAAGDVYALLVEWCHGEGNMPQALELVEQMMDRHIPPGQYLAPSVLEAVQQVSPLRYGGPCLWLKVQCACVLSRAAQAAQWWRACCSNDGHVWCALCRPWVHLL